MLTVSSYEGDEELPRMLYAQVCAQEQRNLRSLSILQVYQVEEPVTNYPEATFTSAKLADKEIVYSRADDWDDVNNAIACLLQTKKVKILELNWRIASIFESSPNYNPSYTGEEYDACCTNFFDRLKTEALTTDGGAKKAPLQILNLSQFNGRGIGPSLIKAFDMSQLSSLLLINSHWLDRLLNALADGRHVPHLHTLVIHSFDEEDTQSFRASIDKLLFSIHALHTLMLRIENTEEGELMWPSMVALVHHAQRLTCLHLSGTANQNFYSVSEMVELQQCQKLEELAIPIPFDPLHESFIWTTEESHTGNRMDALYDAIVPRFSKLRVLHLIADLGFADSELSGYDKDVFRVRCFSQLANIFMLRSMNAKLEILAIGNPTKARPDATAFGLPFCFKRTRVVHSTGLQLAQLCELKTVIREYPATTILQFSSSLGKRFFRVGYDYSTDNIGIAEPALRRLRPKRKASLDKYGHPFDAQRFESRSKHDTMMDVRAGATASKSRFVKLKLYGLPLKSRDLGRQRDAEAAGLGDEENNIAIAQVAEDTASPKSTESAQEDTTALIGAVAGLRL